MTDPQLAVLWLDVLQRVAGRAAHEINNALNGAVVNLEVVRARARPEADAGRVAAFAEAAAEQVEATAALTGALLALVRPPRAAGADAAIDITPLARHMLTLLAPAFAHHGVALVLDAADSAIVHGDPAAARAAIGCALLGAAELAGAEPAGDPKPPIRCTVSAGPPVVVEVGPAEGVTLPAGAASTLRAAGVNVTCDARGATITFRGAGGST